MVETENFESLGAHPFMQFGSLFFNAVGTVSSVSREKELQWTVVATRRYYTAQRACYYMAHWDTSQHPDTGTVHTCPAA